MWNRIVVDRTAEITSWVDVCKKIQDGASQFMDTSTNHYAGFGPACVQLLRDTCIKNGSTVGASFKSVTGECEIKRDEATSECRCAHLTEEGVESRLGGNVTRICSRQTSAPFRVPFAVRRK